MKNQTDTPIGITSAMARERPVLVKWMKNFRQYSFHNDLYGACLFHVLIGQQIRNSKIQIGAEYLDPRISIFYLQSSGSGKSKGWNYASKIAKEIGIQVKSITETTDAALIGGQQEKKVTWRNPTSGQKEEKPEYTPTQGIVAEADIIHYDEASTLLTKSSYSKNALNYFQTALNPINSPTCTITKNLTHINIKFQPHCSFVFTSYMPKNMEEIAIETGLLQRCITFPRYLSEKMRVKNEDHNRDLVFSAPFEVDNKEIITFLTDLKKHDNQNFSLSLHHNLKPVYNNIQHKIRETLLPNTKPEIRDRMETFLSRLLNHLIILSLHSSFMRNDPYNIKPTDIIYAGQILGKTLTHVIHWFESDLEIITKQKSSREKKYRATLFDIMKHPDKYLLEIHPHGLAKKEVVKKFREIVEISNTTAEKYFRVFIEDSRIFWIKNTGREKYYHPQKPYLADYGWWKEKK